MAPFICTNNSWGHVDYGIPLVFSKNTDYRTTSGTFHRFIPEIPTNYDCRVKAHLLPHWKESDITLKNEGFKTAYTADFREGLTAETDSKNYKPWQAEKLNMIRNIEEKFRADPPTLTNEKLSEMKDSYRRKYLAHNYRQVYPPDEKNRCQLNSIGRDEQPQMVPENRCFWKYLDIYLTETKEKYISYDEERRKIADTHLPTYYNINGIYKGFDSILPPKSGNPAIYDKLFIRKEFEPKNLSRASKHVPHNAFVTESSNYRNQCYSDLYPYLNVTGVKYPTSLPEASVWQNLSPPSMYCTEYCHIGTGCPVRLVIDPGNVRKKERDDNVQCLKLENGN